MDWGPLWLTLKLAFVTTVILIVIGVPLAYWLTIGNQKYKSVVAALVSMPLVLPPTVLGFYLLITLGPQSPFGKVFESIFDARIVFSFLGLVIGSVIYSLPFMVYPIKSGFEQVPVNLIEAAQVLGKSSTEILFRVLLPQIRPAFWTGIIMSFAHTMGEFGVVLMLGGSIPDKTRVASIAIFEEVEKLQFNSAHIYSLVLIAISFAILLGLQWMNKRTIKVF